VLADDPDDVGGGPNARDVVVLDAQRQPPGRTVAVGWDIPAEYS
jgi:hypothetical protein